MDEAVSVTGMSEPVSGETRYPLRAVIRRTGLSADVLRAWERRYGAVRPVRSTGGQRLYSADDLERLSLLQRATAAGHSIGEIARLDSVALERLFEPSGAAGAEVEVAIDTVVRDALSATETLDPEALDSGLKRAALEIGSSVFVDDVLPRFLRGVGDRWHRGALTPAHEHLATQTVRRVLVWLSEAYDPKSDAPRVVISTPANEHHELGALLAAAAAAGEGWRGVYLGPNLPALDIAVAATQAAASVVALSVVYADGERTLRELRRLAVELPSSTLLVIGGAAAARLERSLRVQGIRVLSDLAAFRAVLRERRSARTATPPRERTLAER